MISIILPVYNEAKTLGKAVLALKKAAGALGDFEIIIAEDGSDDGTAEIAEKLSYGNVRFIQNQKREGRGFSLTQAITLAKGDIVVYLDVDLSTDLLHLKELVGEIEKGADISTGSRLIKGSKVSNRNPAREFFSRGYNLLLRLMFGTKVHDHQCGFKAFRKSSILPLMAIVQDHRWFWDSELLILSQHMGLKVSEIPVVWVDRPASSVRLRQDILDMGLSAIGLRLRLFSMRKR